MRPGSRLATTSVIALAALLPLLLLPAAEAQARPIIQVNVAASPADSIIRKSHGSAAYTFTISFTCLSGQEYAPCAGHQLADQEVQVVPSVTSDAPTGWEYTIDQTAFRMRARDSRNIPLTVNLLDDEPERPGFSVTMNVRAQPVTNGALDPLLGGTLAQSSTDGDQVKVEKILNWGEDLSSKARRFMWPLLLAAAVLLVTGVVLVERKRGSLDISCDSAAQSITPGRGASFPVNLRNSSKNDDRVHLAVSELPAGWAAIVPLNEIELRGGERTQMWVTVRAPSESPAGQAVSFKLRARSLRGQRSAEVDLSVTVVGDDRPQETVEVAPPPPPPPIDIDFDADATAMPTRPPARPRARRK